MEEYSFDGLVCVIFGEAEFSGVLRCVDLEEDGVGRFVK